MFGLTKGKLASVMRFQCLAALVTFGSYSWLDTLQENNSPSVKIKSSCYTRTNELRSSLRAASEPERK